MRAIEVLLVFLKLGLTSFGGPVAHLGYFRQEIVARRRWVGEAAYADLVALCQFLPGPASSQVGIALGIGRAGLLGGLAAWTGFTLPSAVLLVLFAYGVHGLAGPGAMGWLHGLKVAAVAVVALAVWGMARSLCPDRPRQTLAIGAAAAALFWQTAAGQIAVIAASGLLGWWLVRPPNPPSPVPAGDSRDGGAGARAPRRGVGDPRHMGRSARQVRGGPGRGTQVAAASLAILAILLIALPVLAGVSGLSALQVFDSFFRTGALVFGGGHVVLPLLQAEVVTPGWVTQDDFTAGYGAAQAVPGPLFSFAAFLGAALRVEPSGWVGGALALTAIYVPSFLLIIGALPFWERLRANANARRVLAGTNAAVVGLLAAALYHPVWTSAIFGPGDLALGLAAFGLLAFWRLPPWLVVALCAAGGAALAAF